MILRMISWSARIKIQNIEFSYYWLQRTWSWTDAQPRTQPKCQCNTRSKAVTFLSYFISLLCSSSHVFQECLNTFFLLKYISTFLNSMLLRYTGWQGRLRSWVSRLFDLTAPEQNGDHRVQIQTAMLLDFALLCSVSIGRLHHIHPLGPFCAIIIVKLAELVAFGATRIPLYLL